MLRIQAAFLLTVGTLIASGCSLLDSSPGDCGLSYPFTEEIRCWNERGIDLVVGGEEVDWAIEHTPELGYGTPGAARLYLDNSTDAGKIWMERSFKLEPNREYVVRIRYAFGTTDYSDINSWKIVTGVHRNPPRTHTDLTFQGSTRHDAGSNAGLQWLEKEYSFKAETGERGRLYIAVGVWGTWETPRTYYVDDLQIEFDPFKAAP